MIHIGEISDKAAYEGLGLSCIARDLNGTRSGLKGLFESPDCKKGDI